MRGGGGIAAGNRIIGTGGCSASVCSRHHACVYVPAEKKRQRHSSKDANYSDSIPETAFNMCEQAGAGGEAAGVFTYSYGRGVREV